MLFDERACRGRDEHVWLYLMKIGEVDHSVTHQSHSIVKGLAGLHVLYCVVDKVTRCRLVEDVCERVQGLLNVPSVFVFDLNAGTAAATQDFRAKLHHDLCFSVDFRPRSFTSKVIGGRLNSLWATYKIVSCSFRKLAHMRVCVSSLLVTAPFAIVVVSQIPQFSLGATFFTILANAYCSLFLFCLCIWSAGQSVLSEQHMQHIVFQCLHTHLGAVIVLYIHLLDSRSAFVITQLLLTQSLAALMQYLDSALFRGVSLFRLKLSFVLATSVVMLWSYSTFLLKLVMHADVLSSLQQRILETHCLAVVFVIPTVLLNICDMLADFHATMSIFAR
jgi:hypothetical protein